MRSLRRWSRSDVAWLTGQGVLFLLAFVVLPRRGGGPGAVQVRGARTIGTAVMVLGAVIGVVAMMRLGRNLVPQPTPVEDGTLVSTGLYGLVRHPIYTAVLLLIIGALLRTPSIAGLLVVIASVVFFDRKSAHEERLLAATYPGYEDYRRQVRFKLLPGVR